MLNVTSTKTTNLHAPLGGFSSLPKIEATFSTTKELLHRSLIQYVIPSVRVRHLLPQHFSLAPETILTVESFLDSGRTNFEQTNYRLQVSLEGQSCSWLLGTSLGSLSGVTTRHLYPLPWHLSAMELQVAYNSAMGKYSSYRLRSQSQWANASWEIADTGLPQAVEKNVAITDYFVRRDGQNGTYQTIYKSALATRGILKAGRCDMLNSLGILSSKEIHAPCSVSLQPAVQCDIKPGVSATGVLMAA